MHPFHSPYRCTDCDARFWVISRKTRWGAAAGGAFVVTVLMLALVPMMHRTSGPSMEPSARTGGALFEDSTLRAPSLDEVISMQNKVKPLVGEPVPSDSSGGFTGSSGR